MISTLSNTLAILVNDILISILDASSKHIYWPFLAKKQTTPTAKGKLSAKYYHLTIDWWLRSNYKLRALTYQYQRCSLNKLSLNIKY